MVLSGMVCGRELGALARGRHAVPPHQPRFFGRGTAHASATLVCVRVSVSIRGYGGPGVQHGGCAPRPPGRGGALIWRCPMSFVVGLDLGQSMDHSAVVVVEQILAPPAQPVYEVPLIHRWELGTPYPQIIRTLERTLARPPLAGQSALVVDHTGCGRPVVDQLRQAGLDL